MDLRVGLESHLVVGSVLDGPRKLPLASIAGSHSFGPETSSVAESERSKHMAMLSTVGWA